MFLINIYGRLPFVSRSAAARANLAKIEKCPFEFQKGLIDCGKNGESGKIIFRHPSYRFIFCVTVVWLRSRKNKAAVYLTLIAVI
jgi:hypothetical protein